MKELKRIMIMIAIACMMLCSCTIVNAADSTQIAITEGTKSGNVVTFTITLPTGAGFRGDANEDGKVNSLDVELIHEYAIGNTGIQINLLNADFNLSGRCDQYDEVDLSKSIASPALYGEFEPIALTGTLAEDANTSFDIVKNSSTTYKVDVKVPEGKEGTIGIKVNKGHVVYSDRTTSANDVNSEMLEIKKQEETNNKPQVVNKNITISEAVKDKNKITFNITLPDGVGLRGDANNDGKITQEDVELITNYNLHVIDNTKLNMLNADANLDGIVSLMDSEKIEKELLNGYSVITLNGTLAEKSTYELMRSQDGKYSVIVTVPSNEKGTIGVTLNKDAVVFADHSSNDPISSKLSEISDAKENNNVISTDNTQAKTEIPKAGYKATILVVIASIIVLGTLGYIRYRNIDK